MSDIDNIIRLVALVVIVWAGAGVLLWGGKALYADITRWLNRRRRERMR